MTLKEKEGLLTKLNEHELDLTSLKKQNEELRDQIKQVRFIFLSQ